ncbi:Penicillin-binding protein 2 [Desulfonema magnum]|uniref:Penicillin-binding protein 2 n=2 Tax=Desulfonema magnum TaxID=45655 RepID=A0A975BX90_9BACT|nr:Penicillin-binding protein 2 [Desulfonema magnum]
MDKYLDTADRNWYKHRLVTAMIYVMLAFVVLGGRLFQLQVLEGEEFRRFSENQSIRLQSIEPPRGLIFDRKGNLLADNRPSFDLSIILKDAGPAEMTLEKLSKYADIPKSQLMSKIRAGRGIPSYKPVLLKQDIGRDVLAAIEVHRFDLPGIVIEVRQKRFYAQGRTAAHVTGYMGEISAAELSYWKDMGYRTGDFVGKFGVEKSSERFLRGKRGGRQVEVNAKGQVIRVLRTVDAEPGQNIFLTIDQELQQKAELLMEGIPGAVVAMDPGTGHILAMVSSPSFDPNTFIGGMSHREWNALISDPFRPMENKVIQGEYPPASTYKIVTAIAGLEEGVINRNTTYFCPGYHRYGNNIFRCWKRSGHGSVDIVKALAGSCDVFFYQVGLRLGVDRLADYAGACGLGTLTHVDLNHEARGLIPTSEWKEKRMGVPWQKGENLSIAIGQGYNLVTPLQMAVLTAAVANGGILYRPLIVKKRETVEGRTVYRGDREIVGRLPVSRKNLDIVRKGLWEVTHGRAGTARVARVRGLGISGKTGTAQVVSRKRKSGDRRVRSLHLKSHAWFVAYAEPDDPRIAVAVLVEHGEHGSGTAAPIARELIKMFMGFQGVPDVSVVSDPGDVPVLYEFSGGPFF